MDTTRSGHDQTGEGIAIVIRIGRLTYGHVELFGTSDIHQTAISVRRRRRLMEELHDRGPIEPRSWRDRAAIVNPSAQNRSGDSPIWSDGDRCRIKTTIDARSWPDRGAIVAPLRQKSRLIHRLIGSHDIAKWNRPHDAFNLCPRPDQTAGILGLIFYLKTHVLPFFVLQLLIDSWRN